MNNNLFEQLLYEEEGNTLDFKVAQYRFVKATEEGKSEILKDILGFCNAWRRSEAYILIGVKEVRGGRSEVVGIPDGEHLDDHSLQQFVNNLTNQPIRFGYEAFGFEGKQVGIIKIEMQTRPIYLKRDYGQLQKDRVYVRRGSSTDPQKPASPEEIAQMGASAYQQAAEISVEFADTDQDKRLGTSISLNTDLYQMPEEDMLPDLRPPLIPGLFLGGISMPQFDPMKRPNQEFYREFAAFAVAHGLMRPVRLVVKNTGRVLASDVRVELTVLKTTGFVILHESEMPNPPARHSSLLDVEINTIKSVFHHSLGDVDINRNGDRVHIAMECGNLQPGRQVMSEVFFVGVLESCTVSLYGSTFAGNLPEPENFTLNIMVSGAQKDISVEELCTWADQVIPEK
ncbi:MAG: ATP-binding protein [Chloroflexi bacterium]|nr:ATP-binding protein [Chloroflexota bacterium]